MGNLVEVVSVSHMKQRRRYPFESLQAGDWFDVPVYEHDGSPARVRSTVASSASQYGSRTGKKFAVSCMEENGTIVVRCWRVDGLVAKPAEAERHLTVKKYRVTDALPMNSGQLVITCANNEAAMQIVERVRLEIAMRYADRGWDKDGALWLWKIEFPEEEGDLPRVLAWRAMNAEDYQFASRAFEQMKRENAVDVIKVEPKEEVERF